MSIKFVVIIQCDIARLRCSGFACTKSFYDREGFFKDLGYPHGSRSPAAAAAAAASPQSSNTFQTNCSNRPT